MCECKYICKFIYLSTCLNFFGADNLVQTAAFRGLSLFLKSFCFLTKEAPKNGRKGHSLKAAWKIAVMKMNGFESFTNAASLDGISTKGLLPSPSLPPPLGFGEPD